MTKIRASDTGDHALLPSDQQHSIDSGDEDAVAGSLLPRDQDDATDYDDGADHDNDEDDDDSLLPFDPPAPGAHGPQLVLEWNRLSLDLVAAARRGPTVSSRLFAIVNTALFESWALFQPQADGAVVPSAPDTLNDQLRRAQKEANKEGVGDGLMQAVMAATAHHVFSTIAASLFADGLLPPTWAERSALLRDQSMRLLQQTEKERDGQELSRTAEALAQQIAGHINAKALADGANQQGLYADTTGYQPQPSVFDPTATAPTIDTTWQPLVNNQGQAQTPLTPHWGQVIPFAIASGESLMPASIVTPYASDGSLNPVFVAEANQVLDLSINLTAEQKAIAEYWEAGPGTSFPPGHWLTVTNGLIEQHSLNLDAALALSFGVSQAMFDAGIAAWATKYHYDAIRPITAIRQLYANQTTTAGGEPLTDWRQIPITGQEWQPYQSTTALTPPFPDTVSGHASFSMAAATVLRGLLGTNELNASITLPNEVARFDPLGFDGQSGSNGAAITISWDYLSGAAEQAAQSRLYGGIHFLDGNWLGQIVGIEAGTATLTRLDQLLSGSEAAAPAPLQTFGTMAADQLTGPPQAEAGVELYGFAGDDVLISGGSPMAQLFGGEGLDTFVINSNEPTWIRDFQSSEQILLATTYNSLWAESAALAHGMATQLMGDAQLVAQIDGQWSLEQLRVGSWV